MTTTRELAALEEFRQQVWQEALDEPGGVRTPITEPGEVLAALRTFATMMLVFSPRTFERLSEEFPSERELAEMLGLPFGAIAFILVSLGSLSPVTPDDVRELQRDPAIWETVERAYGASPWGIQDYNHLERPRP